MRTNDNEKTLSSCDQELWDSFTRDVVPLKCARKKEVHRHYQKRTTRFDDISSPPPTQLFDRADSLCVTNNGIEFKNFFPRDIEEKLHKNKINIDFTIDLHGFFLQDSFLYLRHMLHGIFEEGARYILIVTGHYSYDACNSYSNLRARDEDIQWRPTLKLCVPRWLQGVHFSSIVQGFKTAHQRHGGSGAIYVLLKKSSYSF